MSASTRSSADRLLRLRGVLTLLFTVMNALGLILFAWLLVDSDMESREQRMDGELNRVTSTVARLVQYDEENPSGPLVTAFIGEDDLDNECPQFAVLPGGDTKFAAHYSKRNCVDVDRGVLATQANTAVLSGREAHGYVNKTDGGWARVAVYPFRNQSTAIGAVVAYGDADGERDAHDRMVLAVIIGCAVIIGGLGLAGHVLAGRAIRPAAAALEQQEVLLAETAHDLRTPVAALRALAETALRNPTQRAELLPRTVRLAARMGSIIDGLLVRARLAAGVDRLAVQPVQLDQLVTSVVEETPHDGAEVTVTAAPCKVMIDPTLVQRAIGNLLDNALRYGRQPDQKAIVHVTVANGRVTVADHGPGIDGQLAENLFDRFRTGSGSSGLGLSIVRWVAEAHGGMLSVYNAEDAGAIFELALPEVA
jgi:two-component system, OmpR family, sensor kinase